MRRSALWGRHWSESVRFHSFASEKYGRTNVVVAARRRRVRVEHRVQQKKGSGFWKFSPVWNNGLSRKISGLASEESESAGFTAGESRIGQEKCDWKRRTQTAQ